LNFFGTTVTSSHPKAAHSFNFDSLLAVIQSQSNHQLNMNISQSLMRDRAVDMYKFIMMEYNSISSTIKPDETINLLSTISGVEYEVNTIGGKNGILEITVHFQGCARRMLCPVEQVSFAIIVSKKTVDKPQREIGFKAMEDDYKQKTHN
jgi:hypothetical protein